MGTGVDVTLNTGWPDGVGATLGPSEQAPLKNATQAATHLQATRVFPMKSPFPIVWLIITRARKLSRARAEPVNRDLLSRLLVPGLGKPHATPWPSRA